jgi:hypothetical protein
MKPSELKVSSISRRGEKPLVIDHKKKPHPPHHDHHEEIDPKPALRAAKAAGFTVLGTPRRKPKHFEILGRDKAGDFAELHVELDGRLRKTRPVDEADAKWAAEIHSHA